MGDENQNISSVEEIENGLTQEQFHIQCHVCGLKQVARKTARINQKLVCRRCESELLGGRVGSSQQTLAFSLTALLFLIPANFLPFMTLTYYGSATSSTIWQVVVDLANDGSWMIAGVVFLASILLPVTKVVLLFMLCLWGKLGWNPFVGSKIYEFLEKVGRWSMLDIFILGIIISLVKFGKLANANVEPGAFAFLAVVISTMLASISFHPRILWESESE